MNRMPFAAIALIGAACFGAAMISCRTETNLASQKQIEAMREVAQDAIERAKTQLKARGGWPPKDYARVVAYRFEQPDKRMAGEPVNIIRNSFVDMALLEKASVKSIELTPEQSARLVDCVIHPAKTSLPAARYDPHHIFLFYDKDGKLTNAIEVSFEFTCITTLPDLGQSLWKHHDFRGLAEFCDDAGLWMEKISLKEYFKLLDERGER